MNKVECLEKILQKEGNAHTKVVAVDAINGAYYSYFKDSIYISSKATECDEKDIVILCHECIHSNQAKMLHILNVVFSNIEIILFVVVAICVALEFWAFQLLIVYVFCCVLSIILRCALELPAMTKAFVLAEKYADYQMLNKIEKEKMRVNKMLVFGVLSFTWLRLFRLTLVMVLFLLL